MNQVKFQEDSMAMIDYAFMNFIDTLLYGGAQDYIELLKYTRDKNICERSEKMLSNVESFFFSTLYTSVSGSATGIRVIEMLLKQEWPPEKAEERIVKIRERYGLLPSIN